MDNITSFQLVLIILGFIALVVILTLIIYKPKKNLHVECKLLSDGQHENEHRLQLTVENVGKRKLKMLAPFVRFIHGPSSQIYQLSSEKAHCSFPRMIKIGEQVSCEFNLDDFRDKLKKHNFKPSHVKIEIKDVVGMKFSSKNINYTL